MRKGFLGKKEKRRNIEAKGKEREGMERKGVEWKVDEAGSRSEPDGRGKERGRQLAWKVGIEQRLVLCCVVLCCVGGGGRVGLELD